MTKIFTIVVILFLSFTSIYAETVTSEPLEIWSEDQSSNSNFNDTAITLDSEEIKQDSVPIISQADIDYSAYDTIGFYDQTNNGFSPTMWENSEFDDVEFLMRQLAVEYRSLTLNELLNKTLLTISTPPKKNLNNDKIFLDLKLEYYLKSQNDLIVKQILDQISQDDWSDNDLINYLNHFLISDNHKLVCQKKYIDKFKDQKTKLLYQTFCKTISNNLPAADLLLSLLQEQGKVDNEFLYLINTYINGQEIELNEIKHLNLLKLSLIKNKNVDFSNLINEDSNLSLKKYFALSKTKTTEKKVRIIEELVQKNLINSNVLAKNYKSYIKENNIFNTSNYKNAKNNLEKRIFLFSEIRNTSDQKYLSDLATEYVNVMRENNLLNHTYDLIYDKLKVIKPACNLQNQAFNICILLILNNDNDKCNQWSQIIKFNNNQKLEYSLIEYYLYLNSEIVSDQFNQDLLGNIVSSQKITDFNKNIITKHIETSSQIKFSSYWKSKSELKKVSTIVPNIKTIEYLKSLSNTSVGETSLLILILNSGSEMNALDDFSIFSILESLYLIDSKALKNLIFELNIKTIIL
jgi:hypothetical protein